MSPDEFRELIAPYRPKNAKDSEAVETVMAAAKLLVPATEERPVEDIDRYLQFEWEVFDWISANTELHPRKARRTWRTLKVRDDDASYRDILAYHKKADARRTRFKLFDANEVESAPPIDWRIKGLAPFKGLMAIGGQSRSGKTFISTGAALAIASGTPFFGHATKPGIVVYLALEGEAGFPTRLKAWRLYHGLPIPATIRFSCQSFDITSDQDVDDLAEQCAALAKQCEEQGIIFSPGCTVFIDTLNRAAPGLEENGSKDMGRIIAGADRLYRKIDGLVVLVAHAGKDETKGYRGHSSLIAALDASIMVRRDGDAREWLVDKAKDGKDGEKHGFRLEVVDLGVDADGDPVTSCVVVPDAGAAAGFTKPLNAVQKLGLGTLQNAAIAHGVLADDGEFIGVPIRQWREVFYKKHHGENDEAKKKAFGRVRKDLTELGQITVENDVYRFAGPNLSLNTLVAAMLAESRKGTTGHGGTTW